MNISVLHTAIKFNSNRKPFIISVEYDETHFLKSLYLFLKIQNQNSMNMTIWWGSQLQGDKSNNFYAVWYFSVGGNKSVERNWIQILMKEKDWKFIERNFQGELSKNALEEINIVAHK